MVQISIEFLYQQLLHLSDRGAHIEFHDGRIDFNADGTDISRWEFMPIYYLAKLAGLGTSAMEPYEISVFTKKPNPPLGVPPAKLD